MKGSPVMFNEAGRSIESSCLVFKRKKWTQSYLLCSQPNDISIVVLYVYKNHKRRLKNDEVSAIPLSTFAGLETGFELKRQNNTMCVITQTDVLVISFQTAEILTMWETWLYHTCSKGSLFYAQLVEAPETSRAYGSLNREVRLHIHDGRIALIDCYPQRLIGFWFLNNIIRVAFSDNKMQFFANDHSGLDDGMYSFVCGRIQLLEKHYKLANRAGLLAEFLKQKEGDGLWYGEKSTNSSQTIIQNPSTRSTQNPEMNHFGFSSVHRSSSRKSKTSVSQTGVLVSYVNVLADHRFLPISNASSTASCCMGYVNDMAEDEEECLHSQSEPSVSSVGHWDKASDALLNLSSRDNNIRVSSSIAAASCKSLSRADSWPRPLSVELIRSRELFAHTRKWSAANGKETKGRFVKQEKKSGFRSRYCDGGSYRGRSGLAMDDDLQKKRLPKRSRSLGMESRCLSASREENWNRAKRIIGGVRKSINDLNACKAIASSPIDDTNQFSERAGADGLKEWESGTQGFFSSSSVQSVNRLPGLIKLPPKKFGLKRARHILTKSLQKSISGSFSKYDGERSANHFNLEEAKCTGPVVDSIESAVKKGRERLIEAERRNSGFAGRASPMNALSHSVRTTLPENVAVPSTWLTETSTYGTESPQPNYVRRSSKNSDEASSFDDFSQTANTFSTAGNRRSPKKSESLSTSSVRTHSLVPPAEASSKSASLRSAAAAGKETNVETAQSTPFCTPLASLSGSYCNLETRSKNSSRKPSEVSRTVYVQIDPVATLGATQTQETMMRDRARVGNLVKNKEFSSQNNVRSKDRGSTEDGNCLNRGFFVRRLWRKLPASMSHSDLRF